MKTLVLIGFQLATLIGVSACDDRSRSPPDVAAEANKPQHPPQKVRPTTQQLVQGPRNRTPLGFVPVSLELPTSWKVETYGEAGQTVFLEGPAPHDDIKI